MTPSDPQNNGTPKKENNKIKVQMDKPLNITLGQSSRNLKDKSVTNNITSISLSKDD